MNNIVYGILILLTLLGALMIFGMNVSNMPRKHPKIFHAIVWAELIIVSIFTIYGVGSAVISQIIKDIGH